jgi:hypothetical protein
MPAGVATISDCLFLRCKQESVRSQGFSSSDMRRELSRPLNGYLDYSSTSSNLIVTYNDIANGTISNASLLQFGSNYYECVSVPGSYNAGHNTWAAANSAATSRQYNGVFGHLVTITSQAEQDFVYSLVNGGGFFLSLQAPGLVESIPRDG